MALTDVCCFDKNLSKKTQKQTSVKQLLKFLSTIPEETDIVLQAFSWKTKGCAFYDITTELVKKSKKLPYNKVESNNSEKEKLLYDVIVIGLKRYVLN